MRREAMIGLVLPALSIVGCSGVGQGEASYDVLAAATKACQEKGGELKLRSGYDGQALSSYDCVGGDKR
jgi:hypothetical protein